MTVTAQPAIYVSSISLACDPMLNLLCAITFIHQICRAEICVGGPNLDTHRFCSPLLRAKERTNAESLVGSIAAYCEQHPQPQGAETPAHRYAAPLLDQTVAQSLAGDAVLAQVVLGTGCGSAAPCQEGRRKTSTVGVGRRPIRRVTSHAGQARRKTMMPSDDTRGSPRGAW